MHSRVRLGIYFGTGLFACGCLFCSALIGQPAESVPPLPPDVTNAVSSALAPPGFPEQQEAIQQAIEQTRREAETAVKRNADALSVRLDLIEESLAQQRRRELEALQSSNRTTLMVAGILAGTGFLGMMGLAFFLMRATNRLTEMTMAIVPLSHPLGGGLATKALTLGEAQSAGANPAERSGARLLGAIEQLEQRLHELEHTTQAAAPVVPSSTRARADMAQSLRVSHEQLAAASAQGAMVDSEQASRVELLLAKGQTLLNLDQAAEALTCCDEVIALEPRNAEAYIKKGAALEKLRREDEAVECYDRAIAADSSLTTAYLHKGGVFNRLERYQEALACYEQALKTEQKTLAS